MAEETWLGFKLSLGLIPGENEQIIQSPLFRISQIPSATLSEIFLFQSISIQPDTRK